MDDFSKYVPDVHFEQIPIKNLVSNQTYQRALSLSHIQRTVANFDLYQINPVKVSRRDGINYVFNGQHTIEIIATVSGSRETPVWCMVYDDMDYRMEADIFANQQKYVKALSPYDVFIGNIEAGNDKQLVIKALTESYGLQIGPTRGLCVVCAISSLESIFDKYGYHVLDRVLRLCVGTWEGEQNSLSANILKGVAHLVVAYGDQIKDEVFKEKVGAFSAKEISRTGKDRRAGSLGYAEAMLLYYNKKLKNPLRIEQLYRSKRGAGYGEMEADDEPMEEDGMEDYYQEILEI